jgi:hypothetical protein
MTRERILEIIEASERDKIRNSKLYSGGVIMQFNWKNWNYGGKIIFCSVCVAFVALFMNWVDVTILTQNGFVQQGYLLLPCWIYPLYVLLKSKKINFVGGIVSSGVSILFMIFYISSKTMSDTIMGHDVSMNVAATGAWVFLFASIMLLIGVLKYSPEENLKDSFESSVKSIKENVDRFRKSDNEYVVNSETTSTRHSTGVENDEEMIKRLEKLNELKSLGIITEEEFEVEKKKILSSF